MSRQKGFTLVELAIVLVIIGLLLGGVLKGQELIESARVKNIAQDFRSISVAVLSYQDRFRALPGDDRNANRFAGVAACNVAGTADGLINGADWNGGIASEPGCAWQHLRAANLLTGNPLANPANPTHADGGMFGITSLAGNAAVTGLPGTLIVCAQSIRGRHVVPLDALLDDGDPATGSMRARSGINNAAATGTAIAANTAIVDGDPYFVCMGF